MKLGILTQQLRNNYGGLLQAWALQKVLAEEGHSVTIINREPCRLKDMNFFRRVASILKGELYVTLGREKRRYTLPPSEDNYVRQNIIPFVENRYGRISPTIYTGKELRRYVEQEKFDGFVVGSDQVWRPCYSPSIGNYYLDFLPNESGMKRIAYAASFGVDNWEYNPSDTKKCAQLAKKFDLITVRESSGVDLVRKYFNSTAIHVADPTLLLDRDDYDSLVDGSTVQLRTSDGHLFSYVLDGKSELDSAIMNCSAATGYKPYYCNAKRKYNSPEDLRHLDECIFPAVEQWLKSFQDADMIITDSFHGTVFSIIYNKPFWVILNNSRGAARFHSLLDKFGLANRIVNQSKNIDWKEPIDWSAINMRRKEFADYSKELLFSYLNE